MHAFHSSWLPLVITLFSLFYLLPPVFHSFLSFLFSLLSLSYLLFLFFFFSFSKFFYTEYPIKVLLLLLHTLFQIIYLKPSLSGIEKLYLWGLLPLELFSSFFHPLFISPKLPFLPLMAISVYCSVGVIYSFVCLYWHFFLKPHNNKTHKN